MRNGKNSITPVSILVICACIASGCNSTSKTLSQFEKIKVSVVMYKEARDHLRRNPLAKGNEIINECISKLKKLLKLNPEWSEARETLAWCLKEQGSWHEKRSDWYGSLAEGFEYKPGPGWIKAETPPSADDVARYRKIEKAEKARVMPVLNEALRQLDLSAQIIRSSSPRALALRVEIYLIMRKPVEAYEICFHLSMDEKIPPAEQHKFRMFAEQIRRDPDYKEAMQERQRRKYSPMER